MSIKSASFLFVIFYLSQSLANDSIRKGKFLGITGFLSGSSNGLHVAPYWKQWNALLQVNIEKNKHKHNGVYIIPTSSLYYPPYNNYGLYYPQNLAGLGGGLLNAASLGGGLLNAAGLRPTPYLFDEVKPSTTTLASLVADPIDKPKYDVDEDNIDDWDNQLSTVTDENVSFLNLNVRDNDDRQSHKRDIDNKNQTDAEVVATVMEITDPNTIEATTIPSTNEPNTTTTTTSTPVPELSELSSTTTTTTTTASAATTTTTQSPEPDSSSAATTSEISSTVSIIDAGFHPILGFYYGGAPNPNANFIYFTTPDAIQGLTPPTEQPPPLQANDRNDISQEFKPSIQYEYRNYRYETDNHFVPIVGAKQIF